MDLRILVASRAPGERRGLSTWASHYGWAASQDSPTVVHEFPSARVDE